MSEYRVNLSATVRADSIGSVDDDRLADALMALPEVISVEGESPVEQILPHVIRTVEHGMQDIRVRVDGSAWLTDDDGRDYLQIAEPGTVDAHTPEGTLLYLADEASEAALRREEGKRGADAAVIVKRAADALADLHSLVESGSTRLTVYPPTLPSLDDLVADVGNIQTSPTLTADQLTTFERLVHEASMGALVSVNGAVSALSIEVQIDRTAIVRAGAEIVAEITTDGEVL